MYLTFDEFVAFGGENSDNTAEFDSACRKAASYVDYYTQGRLKKSGREYEGVKLAVYEICELLMAKNHNVESYSSDGVSVKLSQKPSFEDRIFEIIQRNVPCELTYLGVDKDD